MIRRAPLATINITPLVDVLLILVAILLLLAPQFVKRLPVQLPQTSISGAPHLQSSLLVTVNDKGELMIEDQPMSITDVKARIRANLTTVEIAASGAAAYSKVVNVVEMLRAAQPREIVLLTR